MYSKAQFKSFLSVLLGVSFEHLDMMLVALYATTLIGHFIPIEGENDRLSLGFLAYGLSFFVKPLGALLLGLLGDLHGRRPALLLSISLMTFATLGLGLIPAYNSIGYISTLLFVLCRILQGLAVGGEYGTAMTYAFELAPSYRTFRGALVVASTHLGGLGAALLASFSPEAFAPMFLAASLLGFLLLASRRSLLEHKSQTQEQKQKTVQHILQESLTPSLKIAKVFLIAVTQVFIFYAGLIYFNEVIVEVSHATQQEIFQANTLLFALWIVLPTVLGYGVDRLQIPYKKVMVLGLTGIALGSGLGLHAALTCGSFSALLTFQLLLQSAHMLFCMGTPRYLGELFRGPARNTSITFFYALSASLASGIAPLFCLKLARFFGSQLSLALPFTLLSATTALCLLQEIRKEKEVRHVAASYA